MAKATKQDIQDALEEFAQQLGLDYSSIREELDGGTVDYKFLPEANTILEIELTKETKEKPHSKTAFWSDSYLYYGYTRPTQEMEATVLGKLNAIAEHLGIDFEVQPVKVVTRPVRVKAVKRTTTKKTPVKAVKKGKK